MPASEFTLRADDGQSLLARRWLPEGRARAIVQSRTWPRRAQRPIRPSRRRAQRRRLRGLRQRPARPRARGRARRSRPFRRRRRLGQGRRRPLDLEPPDRRRAAGNANRLPRPFAGLVPRPRVYRRTFRRAGRRRPFGLERQAADDRDARARSSPARSGCAWASAARATPSSRCGSATSTSRSSPRAPLRLAVARREGGRRLCRRSALRLSVHDPARDRRARRTPPRHEPREPRRESARTCPSTSSPASAIRSGPTSRA